MAENIQVASLTAPITVKIPTDKLNKFQRQLDEIADTLEFIVEQLKDVSKETKRSFAGVGKSLKVQNITQNKFIDGQKQVHQNQKKTQSNAKRTSKIFGSWADKLAQFRVALGLVEFALRKVVQLLVIPSGAFLGLTTFIHLTNKSTMVTENLARSVGVSANSIRALSLEAQELGFTTEHILTQFEEFNNKFGGEAGGFEELNLREGLAGLGLEFQNLQKLKPEEQLEAMLNAGAELVKQSKTNLPIVASAYDKIGGSEANRLWSSVAIKMAESNKQYSEFIGHNKKLVSLSEAAVKGAAASTRFFNQLIATVMNTVREITGLFGKELEPLFDALGRSLQTIGADLQKALGPSIEMVASKLINMFFDLSKILEDISKDPEKIKNMLKSVAKGLETMWKTGKLLLNTLLGIAEFLLTDSPWRSFLAWIGTIVGSVLVASKFFAGLKVAVAAVASTIAGLVAAKGSLAVFAAGTVAAFGPALIMLAKVAAAVAAVTGAIKLASSLGQRFADSDIGNKVTDWLAENVFSSGDAKANFAKSSTSRAAMFGANPNLLNKPANSTTNNSTTNNVTNNIVVNDPETGREMKKEVFDPGRPQ
jgi:hypothetical protein